MEADAIASVRTQPERPATQARISTFDVQLLRREEVAEQTMAFEFTRPSGFQFQAGQAVTLTLVNPPDTDVKGNRRVFSIASPPSDPQILIVTRMRDSAFKRVLKSMPLGSALQMRGPTGTFTVGSGEGTVVMLAGGIGVTPFLSIVREAAATQDKRPMYLFYANRSPDTAAYLPELIAAADTNPALRVVATVDSAPSAWAGERGVIDRPMLEKHVGDIAAPDYYVAGPPPMVAAMQRLLASAGVPAARIQTDEFFGY